MLLLSGSMARQCVMLVILCGVHFRAFRHATTWANGAFRLAVAEIWRSRDCAMLRRYDAMVVLRVTGDGDVPRGEDNVCEAQSDSGSKGAAFLAEDFGSGIKKDSPVNEANAVFTGEIGAQERSTVVYYSARMVSKSSAKLDTPSPSSVQQS